MTGNGLPWWRRPFAGEVWQSRDFRRLWVAQTVSVLGSQVTALALPLTAVVTLGATPGQMGLLRAVQVLPALLFGLLAGGVVDRLRRRPILIWADIGLAVALGAIPLAAAFGQLSIGLLLVVGFVAGVLRLFFDVAYLSILPTLVARQELVEANAKLELSASSATILGPTIGGVLVQVLTAPIAITLDALSFLGSALFIGRIGVDEERAAGREERRGILAEILEGLRFVLGSPILRALAASTATFNLGLGVLFTLYVIFLQRALGLSPALIGVVSAFAGPGYLLGALITGRVTERFGIGKVILSGHLLGGIALLAIPFAGGPWFVAVPVLAAANLANGVTGQVALLNHLGLRQRLTPDRLLGRTNATMRFISWSAAPLAALLGGALGEVIGLRSGMVVGAVLAMFSALWIALSPVRSMGSLREDQIGGG